MNRWMTLTFLVFATAATARAAMVTTTFEDQGLLANSKLDNAGASGQFVSGGNRFNNSNNSGFWSGWAMSNMTDTTTPGYTNQYSAITGSGAGGSATYGVADTFAFPTADNKHPADSYIDLVPGASPLSVDVTNTTYAYLSMKLGDSFALQPFGPGSFFLLDIRGYNGFDGTGQLLGTVSFYLANFLDSNSYIINTWRTLDLTSLSGAKSLRFGLQSSDNDPKFGMNTPAYVAVDNLRLSVVPEPSTAVLAVLSGILFVPLWRHIRRRQMSPAF